MGRPAPHRLPLAVSMGDPAGIGPDIILMAWARRVASGVPPFAVCGDTATLVDRASALGISVPVAETALSSAVEDFATNLPVIPLRHEHTPAADAGRPSDDGARVAIAAIEQAVAAVAAGEASAVVTGPVSKSVLHAVGFQHPGHTEFLAELAARHWPSQVACHPVMMLASRTLRTVPLTIHIPLAQVPAAVTGEAIVVTSRILHEALRRDFGIAAPRIAVCGLNPHASEDGSIGREDIDIVVPALERLRAEGLNIAGPLSADTLFYDEARDGYDVALCMYHDQALIPIKTLAFDQGINVTLGLPFVRTSPDHGTAFSLAGTGKASPTSFIESCKLAAEISERRAAAGQRT